MLNVRLDNPHVSDFAWWLDLHVYLREDLVHAVDVAGRIRLATGTRKFSFIRSFGDTGKRSTLLESGERSTKIDHSITRGSALKVGKVDAQLTSRNG